MRKSHFIAIVAAVGFGISIWAGATAQDYSRRQLVTAAVPPATRTVQQPNPGPDFNGKLVMFSVRGGNQPKLLEQVSFQELYGRRFLVGREVAATFSFPLGAPVHIAWDAVDAFYVFDNIKQYEEAMRQALEQAQGTVSQVLGDFFPGAKCTIN